MENEKDINYEELKKKIKEQMEFYFSDSNFPRDKFLRAEAAKDQEGFVQLEKIASFKRMKNLSEDLELIATSIGDSELVKVQKTKEGKFLIKRITPMPEEDTLIKRSVYVKGITLPEHSTIEAITNLFSPYTKVLSVRLRKNKAREFKGSCFVELANEADIKKLITDAADLIKKYDLKIKPREEYQAEKKEQIKKKKTTKKGS